MICTCSSVRVGGEVLGRNWSPDCPEHDVKSAWYKSPEQGAKRAEFDHRLRVLQLKAKAARRLGIGCPSGEKLHDVGECLVCDVARHEMVAREAPQ